MDIYVKSNSIDLNKHFPYLVNLSLRFLITPCWLVLCLSGDSFYKSFDREVLECIKCYYNQPKRLLRICLPAFISLFLTGAIMLVYQPLASCLWPATAKPDINTAITCFLSPAGLVYALSFGFTFQMVLEKHRRVLKKVGKDRGKPLYLESSKRYGKT